MTEYRESKEERNALRQNILKRRRAISEDEAYEAGRIITDELKKHEFFATEKVTCSYVSSKGEISTLPINEYLLKHHELALPYMDVHIKGHMDFYAFAQGDELFENRYHILEPKNDPENLIIPDAIDAIIVPLVAFDKKGNRMGMGGGYYDRILKKVSAQCLLIGIAYDFQMMDRIPVENWDMPLDEVITPTHHYIFS